MNLKIAWRSLWRNTRRTALTAIVISVGLSFLMFIVSYLEGMQGKMVGQIARSGMGHVQVHHPQFVKLRQALLVVPDAASLVTEIEAMDGVMSVAPRMILTAAIRSSRSSAVEVVQLTGVDPERETIVNQIAENVVDGGFVTQPPEATAAGAPARHKLRKGITLGNKLADLLQVELGSKIRVDMAGFEEATTSAAFYVTGLVATGNENLDRSLAMVRLSDLQEATGAADAAHEFAVTLEDPALTPPLKERIEQMVQARKVPLVPEADDWADEGEAKDDGPALASLEALTWGEVNPELNNMMGMFDAVSGTSYFLVLILMSAGILTTMYMLIYERRREFGIMLAIGTSPMRLFVNIMTEAAMLSFLGVAVGTALGSVFVYLMTTYGIDLQWFTNERMDFAGMVIDTVLIGAASVRVFTEPAMVVFCGVLLFSLVPALRVARMRAMDGIGEG